jgi:maleylpyruvate isomerase
MSLDLHNYFRSWSSCRVRIALNLKGLAYNYLPVHLNRAGGAQFTPAFAR